MHVTDNVKLFYEDFFVYGFMSKLSHIRDI